MATAVASIASKAPKTINKIQQILKITDEHKLVEEFARFEDSIDDVFDPLKELLASDVRTTDVASLQDHMSEVDSYRVRVVKALALATAFLYHCKSDHFIVAKAKGTTEFDRVAYQNKLRAPFEGIVVYLDGVIRCIDSRINQVKKLLWGDKE